MRFGPNLGFGGVTMGMAVGLAYLGLKLLNPLGVLGVWLLAVNLVTFLTYGYDKTVAGSGRTRVPERVLLILALAGGTVGALAGMWAFRHKTAKKSFRIRIGVVIGVQIMLVGAYQLWIRLRLRG